MNIVSIRGGFVLSIDLMFDWSLPKLGVLIGGCDNVIPAEAKDHFLTIYFMGISFSIWRWFNGD